MIRSIPVMICVLCCSRLLAQQTDSARAVHPDTGISVQKQRVLPPAKDTVRADTTVLLAPPPPRVRSYRQVVDSLLGANRFIRADQAPVYLTITYRKPGGKELIFYFLCAVLLIFGLFRTFYPGYYSNLFRVFFNTSVRQTQLTDQLLQARLPSLILNIFFTISVGFYLWLLFRNFRPPRHLDNELLLPICIAGMGALYVVKYAVLKFVGWMSGMTPAANSYIFVIFLVNKVTGIALLPFIIVLAFSHAPWTGYITIFSVLTIGLFFLSRYVKAFGFLEYRFPMEPLHFLIYVVAMEVLPILILYKMLNDYIL